MDKNGLNYTCLFGGGAIRGLSYIGAVRALEDAGIVCDNFAGSSVGSIIASLLAVGYNSEEIKKELIDINYNLFRDIQLGFGPNLALSKGNVFLEWLREIIEKKFYGETYEKGKNKPVTFADLDKNLVIITTDLANFECVEFSKLKSPDYEIASAIRISSCMPGLMKPVEMDDKVLVDGDLQKSYPMWKLSDELVNDTDRILEFRLEGEYNKDELNAGIDYANAVYSCMTAIATAFVTDIYAQKDKFDYITLKTGDVVVVDFNLSQEKREELIESGYEQTMKYLKETLPEKKIKILNAYSIIQGHLLKLKGYLKLRHYSKVKSELGMFFINLSELSSIIDLYDYNSIKHLKDLLIDNLKFGLLGSVKLNNPALVNAELNKICTRVDFKVEELTNYIRLFKK